MDILFYLKSPVFLSILIIIIITILIKIKGKNAQNKKSVLKTLIIMLILVCLGVAGIYIYNYIDYENILSNNRNNYDDISIYSEILSPGTTRIETNDGFINIFFPEHLIDENIKLNINKISNYVKEGLPANADKVQVMDITLGNRHELNSIIQIEINYGDRNIPENAEESKYFSAMYYNENNKMWEYTYYEIDEKNNKAIIKTNHFSKYALVSGDNRESCKPISISKEEVKQAAQNVKINNPSNLELIKGAIGDMDTAFGYTSKFIPDDVGLFILNNKGSEFASFGDACLQYSRGKMIAKYANCFQYLNKNDKEAKKYILGLAKDIYDYGLGALGEYSSKLAGVGTFFIEYSFNNFVEAAFKGSENAYYEIIKDYHSSPEKGGKSLNWWQNRILKVLDNTYFSEDIDENIDIMVTEYLNQLWNNEAELATLIQENGKLSFGGLNEDLKKKIVDKYKPVLYEKRIIPAMNLLKDYNKQMAEIEIAKQQAKLKSFLFSDKYIDIYYDVPKEYKGQYSMDKVKVSLIDDKGNTLNHTNYKGIDFHQLHYLPFDIIKNTLIINKVSVTIPLHDGTNKTVTKPLELSLPGYNSIHIGIPDDYIEFRKEIDDEKKKNKDTEDDNESDEEEIKEEAIVFVPEYLKSDLFNCNICSFEYLSNSKNIDEFTIINETSNVKNNTEIIEVYARHNPSGWEGIYSRTILCSEHSEKIKKQIEEEKLQFDIKIINQETGVDIPSATLLCEGLSTNLTGGYNTISVPKKDQYNLSITADGYHTYQVKMKYSELTNNFTTIGLIPKSQENNNKRSLILVVYDSESYKMLHGFNLSINGNTKGRMFSKEEITIHKHDTITLERDGYETVSESIEIEGFTDGDYLEIAMNKKEDKKEYTTIRAFVQCNDGLAVLDGFVIINNVKTSLDKSYGTKGTPVPFPTDAGSSNIEFGADGYKSRTINLKSKDAIAIGSNPIGMVLFKESNNTASKNNEEDNNPSDNNNTKSENQHWCSCTLNVYNSGTGNLASGYYRVVIHEMKNGQSMSRAYYKFKDGKKIPDSLGKTTITLWKNRSYEITIEENDKYQTPHNKPIKLNSINKVINIEIQSR